MKSQRQESGIGRETAEAVDSISKFGFMWTAYELAKRAQRPKAWEKLLQEGTCEKNWPHDGVAVAEAIRLLKADHQYEAIDRIESYIASSQEEIHSLIGYDG